MDIQEERRKTAEAKQQQIRSIISLCRELGQTKEQTVGHLISKSQLDKEQAENELRRYWKD